MGAGTLRSVGRHVLGFLVVPALLDTPLQDWPAQFLAWGGKPYQAEIAARWLFREWECDWERMTDLPAALREELSTIAPLPGAAAIQRSDAPDGATKLLCGFPDGAAVEAVSMPGTRGRTICLSTQVGCPIACSFCASGIDGLQRNLTAGEILAQVLLLRQECGPFGRVVVMGMGEPGLNLDATLAALDTLLDPRGPGLSPRRVTLSTVAPPGTLARLTAWGKPITLALSLHATNDALRHRLLPGVRATSIEATLQEADRFFEQTGREYTVEYVLIEGTNASSREADSLAQLLSGRRVHVNLIPANPVPGISIEAPRRDKMALFRERLAAHGVSATLRRSLGGSAEAACGQLRRQSAQEAR